MWQLRSGKILLVCLVMVLSSAGYAQDALRHVQIEKVSSTQFRVKYQLNTSDEKEFNSVLLKIFRRRAGNVEEVFSEDITPWSFNQSAGNYTYNWTTEPGLIMNGDELQAKITLTYKEIAHANTKIPAIDTKTTAIDSKASGNNVAPVANAGSFMEIHLPLLTPLMLNGSKSSDADGKIVSYSWKQLAGPEQVHILQKDSSIAFANGITKEGSYAFELTVKDQKGASASDRIVVTVKPPVTNTSPFISSPAVINGTQPDKKTSTAPVTSDTKNSKKEPDVVKSQSTSIQSSSLAPVKLKGGPSNALINLAVPGLGHYYVSGDYLGKGKKPVWFAVTAAYAGTLGAGAYYLMKSNEQIEKYNELANFREYQRDANGNIIGVRGGSEEEAQQYKDAGESARQKAKIFLGASAGILAADFAMTLVKGLKNKEQWKKANNKVSFLFVPGNQITAGIRIKL